MSTIIITIVRKSMSNSDGRLTGMTLKRSREVFKSIRSHADWRISAGPSKESSSWRSCRGSIKFKSRKLKGHPSNVRFSSHVTCRIIPMDDPGMGGCHLLFITYFFLKTKYDILNYLLFILIHHECPFITVVGGNHLES